MPGMSITCVYMSWHLGYMWSAYSGKLKLKVKTFNLRVSPEKTPEFYNLESVRCSSVMQKYLNLSHVCVSKQVMWTLSCNVIKKTSCTCQLSDAVTVHVLKPLSRIVLWWCQMYFSHSQQRSTTKIWTFTINSKAICVFPAQKWNNNVSRRNS